MNWNALILTAILLVQDPYTLKLDVPVVSVDVTVVDSKGDLVNDLTKEDFAIYEDGAAQPIRFFSPVSAPYNVFLLFDSSGSTRENRDFMQRAASKFIENLRPQDSIALGSFDDAFKLNLGWTTDRSKVPEALQDILRPHDSNETHFYAALDRVLRREFKGVVGRRAVVVLTDGQDIPFFYGSNGDFKKVLESTRQQRVPVYIVSVSNTAASKAVFPNTLVYLETVRFNMQRIVENSGGELLVSEDLDDVMRLYEQIGQRLGTSYSLGYVPATASRGERAHRIEVKAHNSNYRLTQSRSTY